MGVIHKLTDEVVQFILEAKKEQASLGCRKLAAMVSERFQVDVSKSAVNSVLKQHELSGSVGRPSGIHSKKTKFTIPTERKQQLLGDVEAYKDLKSAEEASAPEPLISKAPEPLISEPHEPSEEIEIKEDVPSPEPLEQFIPEPPPESQAPISTEPAPPISQEPPLQLIPDPMVLAASQDDAIDPVSPAPTTLPEQDFSVVKERFESNKSPTYAGAGIVLLKAAQSELSLISILARLLEKHTDVGPARENQDLLEAVCYSRFLGIRDARELESSRTDVIWAMMGQDLRQPTLRFWEKIQAVKMPKNFDTIFLNEMQQFGAQIRACRIFLEDASDFILDVDLCSIGEWTGIRQRPLEKALSLVSSAIISNNTPVVIAHVPLDQQDEGLKALTEAFEGVSGKAMVKVQVLNENLEKLAEFSTIPRMKRTFIAGLFPPHPLFAELVRSVKWQSTEPFYNPEFDDTIRFSRISPESVVPQWDIAKYMSKMIILWDKGGREPLGAIVTNGRNAPEDILRQYVMRWPHLASGGSQELQRPSFPNEVDNTYKPSIVADFMDCFDEINLRSLYHLNRKYSLSKDLKHYELTGYIITHGYLQKACLQAGADSSAQLKMMNQADIVDFKGRRLSFACPI